MHIDPETVALFRFTVISEAASSRLGPRERGHVVRTLAARAHHHPDGSWVRITRGTIDRWLRAYRERGLDGLRPEKRSDSGTARRHPELIDLAAALRTELPARSAAHIADIIAARHGVRLAPRTIREQLAKRGLQRAKLTTQPVAYGRYEADRPNELWVGDVLVGPRAPHPRGAGSRRGQLFLLVDDHTRLLVHGRGCSRRTRTGRSRCCARRSHRRGLPEALYLDYADARIMPTLAESALHRLDGGLRMSA